MGRRYSSKETEAKLKVQKMFGQRLAEIRSNKKITQENLSFEIGVDRTYISYIERGERNPSLYILWKISQALKVDLSELTKKV
jgi:transcriptional regulator with XRE-family HTH domain